MHMLMHASTGMSTDMSTQMSTRHLVLHVVVLASQRFHPAHEAVKRYLAILAHHEDGTTDTLSLYAGHT